MGDRPRRAKRSGGSVSGAGARPQAGSGGRPAPAPGGQEGREANGTHGAIIAKIAPRRQIRARKSPLPGPLMRINGVRGPRNRLDAGFAEGSSREPSP